MKNVMMALGLLVVLGLGGPVAAGEDPQEGSAAPALVRVGTFDSRAVAMAYYRSAEFKEQIRLLKQKYAEAKKNGDEERAKELEVEGESSQALAHKQGFGTWPVDDILERIRDDLPGIADEAGVDVIVSQWDIVHAEPTFASVDVTLLMVRPFHPDQATMTLIRDELPKVDPVPLAELEKGHD